MELGMIGLGKMGANMTIRLLGGGHALVVFDCSVEAVQAAVKSGATSSESVSDLVKNLKAPPSGMGDGPSGPAD